jgi:hypothetical protein
MTVLSIHEFDIRGDNATVTALVDNMRLAHRATHLEPDEWAPAVCSSSFELHQDEQIPTNESDLCQYLTDLDLDWQLVDTSDWYL